MPQPFSNAVITNGGARLLTRAQAGEISIQFTRLVIGNGIYTEEEKGLANLQKQVQLKSLKNSYKLSDIEIFSDHSVKVTALITNQDPVTGSTLIEEGYYINEIGLYAKPAGNDNEADEVLYSLAVTVGENGDFMPPYNDFSPARIIQEYYATVSNASEVTIVTNNKSVALAEDVLELRNQIIGLKEDYNTMLRLIQDMYDMATPEDIDRIIGNTYMDVDEAGNSMFEAGTDQDIDEIIGGTYIDEDDTEDPVQLDMSEIVNSAFADA